MVDAATILPSNATALERAMAQVSARLLDIPVPIRELWDVDTCPVEFLPHLAAAWSVDFWNPDWDEAKKRSMIRNAVKHHRLKGTLAGISAYAEIAGAEVLGVIRPPMKFFAGGSDTLAQRLAWLESLPQVKIYRSVAKTGRRPSIVASGAVRPFFLSRRFALPSEAGERSQPKALLIRNGVEATVGIRTDMQGIRTVILRRSAGARVFAGKLVGQVPLASSAAKTVARISADRQAIDPALASPLRPAGTGNGILPAIGSDPMPIGHAWFARANAWQRHAGVSTARHRIFERIAIADELAPAEPRKSTAFASHTRLAVPPHTAELKTSIPGRGTRSGYFAGARRAGSFAVHVDKKRLSTAFEAMRAAKALTDTVLIDTRTYRPFTAGQPFFAGQPVFAGQMTRA